MVLVVERSYWSDRELATEHIQFGSVLSRCPSEHDGGILSSDVNINDCILMNHVALATLVGSPETLC